MLKYIYLKNDKKYEITMPPEKKYEKLSHKEHIMARPDTYVGKLEPTQEAQWIYDEDQKKMVQKMITYSQGEFKIFDEVLVNALDASEEDDSVDAIKVYFSKEDGCITVYNTGAGIDVSMHEKEKIPIPELIFGNLLTSSNYDDGVKRTTGGRNGYGAKLANVLSSLFKVEIGHPASKKKYKQEFRNNMSEKSEGVYSEYKKAQGYVKITYWPDYKNIFKHCWISS